MSSRAALLLPCALALGCGRDVAQTAERVPEVQAVLSCDAPPGAPALPASGAFGDGREPASELVGAGYGAGQGPGLYLLARDSFRVYLNGALVREGAAPRVAEFVPLSLLPGDNALTVVVAASDGAPAALVQLDELERSTVSDGGWRVSAAPGSGFRDAGYDDASWASATDFGAAGALAGCDPFGVFPADSRARWIGPALGSGAVAALRAVVRIRPIGFGESTTGGSGATPVLVSTWEELQAVAESDEPAVVMLPEGIHDFRLPTAELREQPVCPTPCASDATRTVLTVLTDGTPCPVATIETTRDERRIDLRSNKTLVGLGRGAALRGVSIDVGTGVDNVILRNVAVFDVNPNLIEAGDAFGLSAPTRVWLDHCTARWVSDGFTDARPGTSNVTVSWMLYDGENPEACDRNHRRASQVTDSSITFHHNAFLRVASHSPLADHPAARVHVFNNLLSDNADYGVGAACGAQILMEGNVLERVAAPTARLGCPDDPQLGLIFAPADSNHYVDSGAHRGGNGAEPRDAVFVPPYAYAVDPPLDVQLTVLRRAGAGGPWKLPLALD